jgi:arsenate reductase
MPKARAVKVYGLKNCDTVKKARAWLDAHEIAHDFYDYRAEGLPPALLKSWIAKAGWEALFNRASTTFKDLPEKDKAKLDEKSAIALMLAHPAIIKRPVLEHGAGLLVGFKPAVYEQAFGV